MQMTVEDNKIVFREGEATVRYSLKFVQKHIAKLQGELTRFREYERLLTPDAADGGHVCTRFYVYGKGEIAQCIECGSPRR